MVGGVDGEHGEAEFPFADRVTPRRPQASDAWRLAFRVREQRRDGLAGAQGRATFVTSEFDSR
jgi:hypothetical protein